MNENLTFLQYVKRTTVKAIFSDDDFLDLFTLKGGTALDLVYNLLQRSSIDVDLSMDSDLPASLDQILPKFSSTLRATFEPDGYLAFDITISPRPAAVRTGMDEFWGGYQVSFKLIKQATAAMIPSLEELRRNALMIGEKGKFTIDISKYEFTANRVKQQLDQLTIFVYSPEMLVAEKLRAICQQDEHYAKLMKKTRTPRARDFVDIYAIQRTYSCDFTMDDNLAILRGIFEAKRVSRELLLRIKDQLPFHEADFPSVQATMPAEIRRNYDFHVCAAQVIALAESIESLWHV